MLSVLLPVQMLPPELWRLVISYIDIQTLCALHAVSKELLTLSKDMRADVLVASLKAASDVCIASLNYSFTKTSIATQRLLCIITTYIRNPKYYRMDKYMKYGRFLKDVPSLLISGDHVGYHGNIKSLFLTYDMPRPLSFS